MRHRLTVLMVATALSGVLLPVAHAQRGVGEPVGVARQAVKPETATFVGTVGEMKIGPCESTTGRSPFGAHFLMKSAEGQMLNIHLGPTAMVEFVADDLTKGMEVKVDAFRTGKMKDGHYVAKSLSYSDRTVTLRDETLRPVWAGGGGGWRTRDGFSRAACYGPRVGYGPRAGWGRGRGFGRGGRG